MSLPRVVVVGGHGKIALHFARLASKSYSVHSLVRSQDHFEDIRQVGATPDLVSIEDVDVGGLTKLFEGAKGVVFAAGAGGKGGAERTKKVDYEAAVKVRFLFEIGLATIGSDVREYAQVFDAIEQVKGTKPKLVLVGALDTRDMSKPPPPYYTATDIEKSEKSHKAIKVYYEYVCHSVLKALETDHLISNLAPLAPYRWKLEADRDLVKRKSFEWTILRPGTLLDEAGTGKVTLGRVHPEFGSVPREDVAAALLALLEEPKSAGLTLDLGKGSTPLAEAVKSAVEKGETDFYD